jgi:hypothetical protein
MSLPKRVRDKIEFQHSATPDRTACWIWTGYLRNDDRHHDYPIVSDGNSSVPAHRYVYERLRKPIPDGKTLRPTCPNSSCVNPNHMEIRKGEQ